MSSNTPEVFRSQTDIIEILRALDYGTSMYRFKGRREPIRKLFCLKLETFEIQQFPITSSHSRKSPQPEEYGMTLRKYDTNSTGLFSCTVNVREIKEVRLGTQSRDFDRSKDDMKRIGVDQACCFSILYGQEFKLKVMCLVGKRILARCSG